MALIAPIPDSARPPTPRTTVRRRAQRGVYDWSAIAAILDEALVCHVGVVVDGYPCVIPSAFARVGESLYLHGSPSNRMLRTARDGGDVCVTVTLLDGIVLARSAFHHSMNYRSVVIFGRAEEVRGVEEKRAALAALVEHVVAGRSAEVRAPTDAELTGTLVLRLPIAEASAKVRTGPSIDDEVDYALPVWAGVIPLALRAGTPERDGRCGAGLAIPGYALAYARRLPSDP